MALHKGLLQGGFKLPWCEKHFHDSDEAWVVLQGKGTSYWVDHDGRREDFELDAGDVWLVPAGYEHGSDGFPETGRNSDDFTLTVFLGTEAPGSHPVGHYYMEEERYVPSFQLVKTPIDRYRGAPSLVAEAFAAVRAAVPAIADAAPPDALEQVRGDAAAADALRARLHGLGGAHRDTLEQLFAANPRFAVVRPWVLADAA
jgi:mannose-6-phosphate isomerase-like protein (cupin superfamily)